MVTSTDKGLRYSNSNGKLTYRMRNTATAILSPLQVGTGVENDPLLFIIDLDNLGIMRDNPSCLYFMHIAFLIRPIHFFP